LQAQGHVANKFATPIVNLDHRSQDRSYLELISNPIVEVTQRRHKLCDFDTIHLAFAMRKNVRIIWQGLNELKIHKK
jgi:hypothetical protein